jgi:type IV pilus assembly protein PilE
MKLSITPSVPSSKGFTLVELMATIMIGAILAAIAIPGFTSQIRKSRRTEARNAVLDAAAREERFFATHNVYSATGTDLGYATFPAPVGQYYTLTVACAATGGCATGFLVTASAPAASPQTKDVTCTSFMVDQTGLQSAIPAANTTTCWN